MSSIVDDMANLFLMIWEKVGRRDGRGEEVSVGESCLLRFDMFELSKIGVNIYVHRDST
jgi:hypothetical protein